jgi:hypothetical protein
MALEIGTLQATSGMTKAIFDQIDTLLSPPLQKAVDEARGGPKVKAQEALDLARDGWRKLAFSIATGVIGHLLSNLEVVGVKTKGDVAAAASNVATTPGPPGPHTHLVTLTANQNGVTFTQSNDGTGRVK